MEDVKRWFKWMVAILVLHMVEQLLFGIDELYEVKAIIGAYQTWVGNADYATVVLVLVVGVAIQFTVLAGLVGGRWTLVAPGVFAVEGLAQMHHIVKTIAHGAYFPGAVTAIPYVPISALLLVAVIRELRAGAPAHIAPRAIEA